MTSVLLVANFVSVHGLNRGYTEELADRLERRGHRVTRTSSELGRARRLLDMLATTFRRRHDYQVAVIDVFSGPSFVWAEAVAFELRRLGKPYVLQLHGGLLPVFAARWPRRVRHLLHSAVAVTSPSGYLAEQLRAYRADIAVVPNAVDVDGYVFTRRARVAPQLVWVRALHEMYNPVLAVEVVSRVAQRYPEARLVMVGPDKDGSQPAVEQRASELAVRDRVDLVGGVAARDIAPRLAAADIFLNTTNADNTPLSVLEAMASGLCIVSTDAGGLPYLLRDRETARLVPPKDAGAMAAAVLELLDDPALAARLSANARAAAEERSWANVLAQWEQLLADSAM